MARLNLRPIFASLQAMPYYVSTANTITPTQAQAIAARFGACAEDHPKDFAFANECAATPITRADSNGNGLGLYHSAERLFFGYLYDLYYCAACEDAEAARHGD